MTDYLQTLGDARDALSAAHGAAARVPITNKTVLAAALTTMDSNLSGQFQAIGDPLSVLNTDQTLASAIQADPGCATVLDFYKPATTSGLNVGDCTTPTKRRWTAPSLIAKRSRSSLRTRRVRPRRSPATMQ